MKTLKRHLFSFIALLFATLTLIGWWRSTQIWKGHHIQTPYGFFDVYSESSLFVIAVQFSSHEVRWSVHNDADPIEGDSMRFPMQFPKIHKNHDQIQFLIPHWQLALFFVMLALIFYILTIRKAAHHRRSIES